MTRRGPKVPSLSPVGLLCGISQSFPTGYPPRIRANSQALLTRPPLDAVIVQKQAFDNSLPLDLHVLGLPPAFNLSHDQTLQFKILSAQ